MRHGSISELGVELADKRTGGAVLGLFTREPYQRLFKVPTTIGAPQPPDQELAVKLNRIAEGRNSGLGDPLPNEEHDGIPAGYTYFGQFVVHDMTRSELTRGGADPQNRTSGKLDLDSLYGDGPALNAYFFQPCERPEEAPYLFYLGKTAEAQLRRNRDLCPGKPLDVPRIDGGSKGLSVTPPACCIAPLTADARNDENLVTAQLLVLFMTVHNRVAAYLKTVRGKSNGDAYDMAKRFVVRCFRQIVLFDYARRLLSDDFYRDLQRKTPELIKADGAYLPLEFVFGAARLAHSMSRKIYKPNDRVANDDQVLDRLLSFSSSAVSPNLPLPADWVIDWSNFFEIGPTAPQMARRFSPMMTPPLVERRTGLPRDLPFESLAFRDLWRCYQIDLPSGQQCAAALAKQLGSKLSVPIISGGDMMPTETVRKQYYAARLEPALQAFPQFLSETPLSYYLAQEASLHGNNGRTFGPLGAYIFASALRSALVPVAGSDGWAPWSTARGVQSMPDFIALTSVDDDHVGAAIDATLP